MYSKQEKKEEKDEEEGHDQMSMLNYYLFFFVVFLSTENVDPCVIASFESMADSVAAIEFDASETTNLKLIVKHLTVIKIICDHHHLVSLRLH